MGEGRGEGEEAKIPLPFIPSHGGRGENTYLVGGRKSERREHIYLGGGELRNL
jgi:hypothetical protein